VKMLDRVHDPCTLRSLCEMWMDSNHEAWIVLRGGSMAPTIVEGSRVRVRFSHRTPAVGDIVAYRNGNSLVVHRLVDVVDTAIGMKIIFRGDGNADPDPPVPIHRVVGVVLESRGPSPMYVARQLLQALVHFVRASLRVRPKAPKAGLD
jgi:signal peptidase I